MRALSIFRACAMAFGLSVLGYNYAHASYAAVVPQVAPVGTGVANIARITGGVVSAGYVFTTGVLALGARSIVIPMAFRIAAGAAVAVSATAAAMPLIVGGVVLGAAAPYIIDWLQRAHAQNMAMDLYYDQASDRVIRQPSHGFSSDYGTFSNSLNINVDNTMTAQGVSLRAFITNADNPSGYICGRAPYVIVRGGSPCGPGIPGLDVVRCVRGGPEDTRNACIGGAIDYSGTSIPGAPLTATDVEALQNVAVNPAILPALGQPVPVDPIPVMNPPTSPQQNTPVGPGVAPAPTLPTQPLRIPDGEPVPIPNTTPQQYTQPWQEVIHAPTADDPYRVDVRPITTTVTDPVAPTVPVTVPAPTTGNPSPGTSSLTDCDKYPGSLGCMPVGTPPPDGNIPTQTRTITQQQGPSFGGGGSCPANLMLNIHGQSIKALDMAQPCSWIVNFVKPIILLLAAISAVMIVAPRSES